VGILVFQLAFNAAPCLAAVKAPAPQDSRLQKPPTLKEKLLEVDPGTMLLVKLSSNENLRGRLPSMTDDGFTLQIAKGDKLSERTVAFSDVKSLKVEGKHGAARTVGYGVLWGLAALGTFMLIVLIAFAAGN